MTKRPSKNEGHSPRKPDKEEQSPLWHPHDNPQHPGKHEGDGHNADDEKTRGTGPRWKTGDDE